MSSTLNVKLVHNGQPVPFGAYVRVAFNQDTDDQAYTQHYTDPMGTVAFEFTPPGQKRIYPHAAGFSASPVDVAMPHDDQLVIEMEKAVAPAGDFLHLDGLHFATADNRPWLFAGYCSYTIISEVQKGHDIDPFLEEALSYGANTLVALGMDLGPFAHDHGFAVDPRDPAWPTWLATIYDRCAAKGLRAAIGCFQQAHALSDAQKKRVWEVFCAVAKGRWNALPRMGNEDDVNGWSHKDLPAPGDLGGALWSTGSRGINNPPVPPNGDWAEWEPPRDPRAKTFSDAGGAGWYMYDGYPEFAAVPKPIVCIEPPFFHDSEHDQWGDKRWYKPSDALTLGLNIGANFAGGAFGSSEGLETRPNGPIAAACAREFFRGLRAAFLR